MALSSRCRVAREQSLYWFRESLNLRETFVWSLQSHKTERRTILDEQFSWKKCLSVSIDGYRWKIRLEIFVRLNSAAQVSSLSLSLSLEPADSRSRTQQIRRIGHHTILNKACQFKVYLHCWEWFRRLLIAALVKSLLRARPKTGESSANERVPAGCSACVLVKGASPGSCLRRGRQNLQREREWILRGNLIWSPRISINAGNRDDSQCCRSLIDWSLMLSLITMANQPAIDCIGKRISAIVYYLKNLVQQKRSPLKPPLNV